LAPPGLQGLGNRLWLSEFELTGFFGNDGALWFRLQLGNKLGDEAASLLWVQVTGFFGNIYEGSDDLVVLLTLGITNKLAGLLLDVLGGARGFIDSAALLRTLAIANLFNGPVAFLHGLIESLLLEGDLTGLLEVLLTNLLLSG